MQDLCRVLQLSVEGRKGGGTVSAIIEHRSHRWSYLELKLSQLIGESVQIGLRRYSGVRFLNDEAEIKTYVRDTRIRSRFDRFTPC